MLATSRRRFLARAGAVGALGLLAAACGAPTTPATTPAEKPAEKPAGPPTAAAAAGPTTTAAAAGSAAMNPAAAKGKELRMLAWAGYKGDGIATWLPDFEKEIGGKVVLDLVPGDNLTEKQIVVLSARTGEYDLTTVDESNVPAMNPFLVDLTSMIQADKIPVDDWIPVVWAAGTWEGKQYTIPFDPNVQILYYRKDVLDQKGLKVPQKWSEALDVGDKAQERDKQLWGFLLMTQRNIQTGINFWNFITTWGNEIFDANNQVAFVNEKGVQAAEFMKRFVDTVAPQGHLGWDYAGLQDGMATGKGVLLQNWASVTLSIINAKNATVADKIGFAPVLGEEKRHSMRGVWTLGISADSKNRDAAWEFAKWFTSHDGMQKYVKGGSGNSGRLSVLNSPEFRSIAPHADALVETLKIAKNRPLYKETADIHTAFDISASKLTTGDLAPKEAIDDLARQLTDIMKRGGYIK
jgi:multiple sugar transport system substrate-binding protein